MAEDRVVLAVILGAHGVRGDVRIKSFTENPADCLSYGPLMSADGNITLSAKSKRVTTKGLIITPTQTRQREEWEALKGVALSVPRERLPEADDDEFYVEDMIGLTVVDAEHGSEIGTIKAVHNFGAGDLLEIRLAEGGTDLMVPLTEEDVPEIDIDAGKVSVANVDLWNAPAKAEDQEPADETEAN